MKSRSSYNIFSTQKGSSEGMDNPNFQDDNISQGIFKATDQFEKDNRDSPELMISEEMERSIQADWLNAIIADDTTKMQEIANDVSEAGREQLFRGNFTWSSKEHKGLTSTRFRTLDMTTSLTVSIALRSTRAIEFLLKNDCDVEVVERCGVNIIHIIIVMASLNPGKERDYCNVLSLLKSKLPKQTYKKLLLMEDERGARPLECAISHDTFILASEILNDPCSLYLKKVTPHGAYIEKTFDLTEYETTRQSMSPLSGLIFIDKKCLEWTHAQTFFNSGLMQSWMKAKVSRNLIFMLLWLVFRVFYVSIFFYMTVVQYVDYTNFAFYTVEHHNLTASKNSSAYVKFVPSIIPKAELLFIFYFLVISSLCMIVFDIYDLLVSARFRAYYFMQNFSGWKSFVVTHLFYRVSQLILAVCVFLLFINGLLGLTLFSLGMRNFITINITINAIWSLMYFFQLLPWIGHFVIAIQQMITDLFQFLIILICFMIPFWLGFQRMFSQNPTRTVPREFKDPMSAMYSTFLISFDAIDLSELEHADETGPAVMHIMYTLMVPILLFNLLIAVFSNSYAHVWQNRNLIMTIQRLALAFTIEKRFGAIFSRLYNYMDRYAFNKQCDGYFITIHEMANNNHMSARVDSFDPKKRNQSVYHKRYSKHLQKNYDNVAEMTRL